MSCAQTSNGFSLRHFRRRKFGPLRRGPPSVPCHLMNRHPASMSRAEVLTELRSLRRRTVEQAGGRVTSLTDQDLRELLVIARLRQWSDTSAFPPGTPRNVGG